MLNVNTIPAELKALKQWVCWNSDKIPKNPYNGKNAQSNNRETWGDFETAVKATTRYNFTGVGFMFDNGYFGVDLDDCISEDNQDFIDEFVETLQSYTEISQSGKGLHIICKGTLPNGMRRKGKVEMYQDGRYFAMTGNLYRKEYDSINDCTESIRVLHAKYLSSNEPLALPRQVEKVYLEDSEIIDKARNCKTGSVFQLLYSGQYEGLYETHSQADMALCLMLAFWTQRDEQQMDRIFRSSQLYRRKWDEKRGAYTYGEMTIQAAVSRCNNVYEKKDQQDDKNISLSYYAKDSQLVVQKPKKKYDMTDTGNAQRMADRFGEEIRYSYVNKKWYYWTGKTWVLDYYGYIKKLADMVVEDLKKEAFAEKDPDRQEELLKFANKTASNRSKTAMITETQHLDNIPIMPEDMDRDINLLNCPNGVINLRNGEFMKHDSNLLQSKMTIAEYCEDDKEPRVWLKFLDDVTNGDLELQRYLQKCVGYSLTGSTQEQCAFFLYGIGNNGKSTFVDTISEALGSYAANVQPETIMVRNNSNSGANSDVARLKSIRFATCEEPSEGVRLNEALVKQLTGGGKVTARFLYGDDFEFMPEFKIWMTTNHKPVIRGTDFGIWRRIRLIPFEVNIPKEKVDKKLKYKLRQELPQILKWAIEGCMLWQQEGLEPPEAVERATAEYKNEMDILAAFCESCLVIDNNPKHTIAANMLFSIYQGWANANNEYVMTSRKFFLEIARKVPEKVRSNTGINYKGIVVSDNARKFIQPAGYKVED